MPNGTHVAALRYALASSKSGLSYHCSAGDNLACTATLSGCPAEHYTRPVGFIGTLSLQNVWPL